MGLYVGDSDNLVLMLGDTEVSAAYLGDTQVYPMSPFAVSPSRISLNNVQLTANLRIKSPEAWTITDTSGGWLSYSASSGAAGTTTVTVTATVPSATRTATISVTTANYGKNISVEQLYVTFTGFYVENVSQTNGTLTVMEGVNLSHNLEYSTDGVNWTAANYYAPFTLSIAAGQKVYMRGTNSYWRQASDGHNCWYMDVDWKIGGNMLSIIDKDNFETLSTVPQYAFQNAFVLNPYLVDASDANMGTATTLGVQSMHNSFADSAVVGLPDLSGITRGEHFCVLGGCARATSLQIGYNLGNITYMNGGQNMQSLYEGCSSLTTAYAPNITNYLDSSNSGNWLLNVAPSGTLYVAANYTPQTSASGCPSGWTLAHYN